MTNKPLWDTDDCLFSLAEREGMTTRVREIMSTINENREAICQAFIASTGCKPEDCEQVIQETPGGVRFYVQRRDKFNDARVRELLTAFKGSPEVQQFILRHVVGERTMPPRWYLRFRFHWAWDVFYLSGWIVAFWIWRAYA